FGYTTQNFDSTITSGTTTTLPGGWIAGAAATTVTASAGTSTAGYYLWGAASSAERALGSVDDSATRTIGVYYQNNTGRTVTQLSISYKGEQWRAGTGSSDKLVFAYSTDAAGSLTSGTWNAVTALDFASPNAANNANLVGNNSPNFTYIGAVITGLSIANGGTFTLRWQDLAVANTDDGLGVDDFAIAVPEPATVGAGVFLGTMVAAGWFRRQRARRAKV
ncbi:MAG: hypothetical protein WCP53_16170, partial [Verrucomicrobiota bacterium]